MYCVTAAGARSVVRVYGYLSISEPVDVRVLFLRLIARVLGGVPAVAIASWEILSIGVSRPPVETPTC